MTRLEDKIVRAIAILEREHDRQTRWEILLARLAEALRRREAAGR